MATLFCFCFFFRFFIESFVILLDFNWYLGKGSYAKEKGHRQKSFGLLIWCNSICLILHVKWRKANDDDVQIKRCCLTGNLKVAKSIKLSRLLHNRKNKLFETIFLPVFGLPPRILPHT